MSGKNAGVDPEIFKRGAMFYISHDGWITKKILPLTLSKKARIMLETISLSAKYFVSILNVSSFLYPMKACLPMKSYHLLKFYKCFDKKREESLIQQSMKKEKVRKAGLCFMTGCFLKPFKILINHFFLFPKFIATNFCFLMSG